MHELPQLGKLERKYQDVLTVIGVQAPKYPAESEIDDLARAVERYGITHPVVNDPEYRVWDAYAVKAWPTLVFVSPAGTVVGSHAGETSYEALDQALSELVRDYERDGSLVRRVGPQGRSFSRPHAELSYPGNVLVAGHRLFIADSGHNRVLVCGLDGQTHRIIGAGERGWVDGGATEAQFNNPQGMALDRSTDRLYVADADNHVIRMVDLATGVVSTAAGTGEQARRVMREGPAGATSLSSPWDLVLRHDVLYIAMAGLHQVWALDLSRLTIGVWAGTGHEGLRDGPRLSAWLAQPMALTSSDSRLLVSCAEAQALRAIDFESGEACTLLGRGLFDFGDVDGAASTSLMQHPQGAEFYEGRVYVADTYNQKIKRLDLEASTVATVVGSGLRGTLDGPAASARLWEPSGLSMEDGQLFIADTNNHAVRRLDLESGHLYTLDVRGV